MKRFIAMLIIVAALFASSIVVHAESCDSESAVFVGSKAEDAITVTHEGDYIEVKTRNVTYRVYPCGKLEKLTWKELNPNEDRPTLSTWSGSSITGTTNSINAIGYVAY